VRMGTIVQVTTTVREDGSIEIRAPGLTPGQQVTVSIATADEERRTGPHILDAVAWLKGHRIFTSVEEVDAFSRSERDTWDQ
jgi:hypothetical protein